MAFFQRYLLKQVKTDLVKKMVFVGGPRQVGKTTMALQLLKGQTAAYLNWDTASHREKILRRQLPLADLLVFDEIHKYRQWRNYLKGLYDEHHQRLHILVTGSARLDLYRFGGDSLQGRYHYLRLHPLSVKELDIDAHADFMDLLKLGGFPEPFFSSSQIEAKRWSREYRTRLFTEDIATLERVQNLGTMELLNLRLPELVGSPLSINALREDLQMSHKTVSNWLQILERVYAIFRLPPFGASRIRAVKKEQKHYHIDWSIVPDQAKRFENLVASHLLKWVHYQQDVYGGDYDLCYFRDIDGREIDFVITDTTKPILAVECKWRDTGISQSLRYFKSHFPDCRMVQITAQGKTEYLSTDGVEVRFAHRFLSEFI